MSTGRLFLRNRSLNRIRKHRDFFPSPFLLLKHCLFLRRQRLSFTAPPVRPHSAGKRQGIGKTRANKPIMKSVKPACSLAL